MLGAIVGDVIGSRFELNNLKDTNFKLFTEDSKFTDDTVLTVATANAILNKITDFGQCYRSYAKAYGNRGYGKRFLIWANSNEARNGDSIGNGAAMRVSPIAFANTSLTMVIRQAQLSAEYTHNSVEGIKGAKAIAAAVFLANIGCAKKFITDQLISLYNYDLRRNLKDIRTTYTFDNSAKGSVPEAIIAFLESETFEHAIRLAVSIGGDSDTIASMTGAIAQAYYKHIPQKIITEVVNKLPPAFINIIIAFNKKFNIDYIKL